MKERELVGSLDAVCAILRTIESDLTVFTGSKQALTMVKIAHQHARYAMRILGAISDERTNQGD